MYKHHDIPLTAYPTREALSIALADKAELLLSRAIMEKGYASMVVSGGTTPKPFFVELHTRKLRWDKLTITLADERWVPVTSEESNEHLVREYLLHEGVKFIGLKNDALTPEEGAAQANQAILGIPRPFDLVILGMGEDGHTASLFPRVESALKALDCDNDALCMPIRPAQSLAPRMSLTASCLLNSHALWFHITGQKKREVIEAAWEKGKPEMMSPVSIFLHQDTAPVSVFWAE
ncbi:MAG: 6-phosphogluconolactonase [Rickettsiales bacterium]|jgi:6-phosphogluconolactonase|nr:6-phosphogluconolactonase [Rickettsiales bacterium]